MTWLDAFAIISGSLLVLGAGNLILSRWRAEEKRRMHVDLAVTWFASCFIGWVVIAVVWALKQGSL